MSIVKPFTDIFTRTGALRYFAVASGVNAASSIAGAGLTMGEAAYHDDPNTWERTGQATGAAMGNLTQLGADIGFMRYFGIREGGAELSMLARDATGQIVNGGHGVFQAGGKLLPGGAKGLLRDGEVGFSQFMKGGMSGKYYKMRGLRGFGLGLAAIAVPMLAQAVAPSVMGFVGKVMDEASADMRKQREIHYDSRYFNTDRYDMSTFQQVGAAMDTYQNKMLSLARIYHAR